MSEQGIAFCSDCGTASSPDGRFCSSCGSQVPAGQARGYAPPSSNGPALPSWVTQLRPSATGWGLCGGAIAIVAGSLLPWAQVSDGFGYTISSSPTGGAPVSLMVLAAGAVAFGWPLLRGDALSRRRWLGLIVTAGLLAINIFAGWAIIIHLQSESGGASITAGSGLFLSTVGVVVMWVGVIRLWLARRRPVVSPH